MGWASSATGGGYGGGGGRGNDRDNDRNSGRGGGGYDGAVGAGVDASSTPGRNASDRGNGGFGNPDTHTNFDGSSVSTGTARVGALARDIERDTSTTPADRATPSRRAGGFMGEVDATRAGGVAGNMGMVTNGMVASMDDAAAFAERSFMNSLATNMTPAAHTASLRASGLPGRIQSNARPGLAARGLSLAAGILGGPLGGLVANAVTTGFAADEASDTIAGINDSFGTSLDASYSNSLGRQAMGSLGGFVGGKVGGTAGSRFGGSLAGVPGAIAGGLIGGAMGSQWGRDAAFNDSGSTPGTGMGNGSGNNTANGFTSPSPTVDVATAGNVASPSFGFADFDGYASYAERFFA